MGKVATAVQGAPLLQRCCDKSPCDGSKEAERLLQRRSAGVGPSTNVAPPIVHDVLSSGGRPLANPVRKDMESRLQHDFSGVRIHTDAKAGASASAVAARAYTVGQQIVFNTGEYRPQTAAGRSVIAHELAHTIQQRGTAHLARSPLWVGPTDDPSERQADAVGKDAAQGERSRAPEADAISESPVLRRLGDPTKVPPGLTCPIATSSPASVFKSIEFPQGSAALSPGQAVELQNVIAAWEAADTSPTIRVDGYASTEGSDQVNWRLSCDRAYAVFAELTAHTSGPPGIPETSIETFAQGETSEFSPTLPPNRRVTISSPQPLPAPVCTHPGVSRTVELQPVFFRDAVDDTAPTGNTWRAGLNSANQIWGKLGVTFVDLGAVTLTDATSKVGGGTEASTNAVRATRTGAGIEVFYVDNDMAWIGGGVTFNVGTASAQTVISDRPGSVPTLCAHELGHVLGLGHPGLAAPLDVEANTIMTPTGSRTAAHTTRNPISNFQRIRFPAGSGSTCLLPDP